MEKIDSIWQGMDVLETPYTVSTLVVHVYSSTIVVCLTHKVTHELVSLAYEDGRITCIPVLSDDQVDVLTPFFKAMLHIYHPNETTFEVSQEPPFPDHPDFLMTVISMTAPTTHPG